VRTENFIRANQRYMHRFWPLIFIYIVLCIGGPLGLASLEAPPKWLYAAIGLSNALPILFIFLVMGKWLNETDEYTRAQQVQAILIGGAIVLSFSVIWGFLELYRVVPNFWSLFYGPMFFVTYGATYYLRGRFLS